MKRPLLTGTLLHKGDSLHLGYSIHGSQSILEWNELFRHGIVHMPCTLNFLLHLSATNSENRTMAGPYRPGLWNLLCVHSLNKMLIAFLRNCIKYRVMFSRDIKYATWYLLITNITFILFCSIMMSVGGHVETQYSYDDKNEHAFFTGKL